MHFKYIWRVFHAIHYRVNRIRQTKSDGHGLRLSRLEAVTSGELGSEFVKVISTVKYKHLTIPVVNNGTTLVFGLLVTLESLC